MRRRAAALAGSLALGAAAAQSNWYVQMDNDLGFETDRWYSSGFRAGRVVRSGDHEREWGVLHEIYTPDVKGFRPGSVDRMPTARLLLTTARHERTAKAFQTYELGVGVRGPTAGGEDITRLIHRVVHARDIDWSRQDRNRLDFHVVASRTQQVLEQVNVNYGVVAGNELAFGHVGAELRFGAAGADAPTSAVVRFAASPPPFGPGLEGCWSSFVGANARAVWRNQMLDRGYALFGPPPTRRRAVARAAAGFSYAWDGGTLTFTVVHESREFAQQSRAHTFGSLAGYVDF